jgi:predicted DNA-binding transcriptional regulator YafY
VDRIHALTVSSDHFSHEHPSFPQYLDSLGGEQNLHKVIIQMDKDISRYIEQDKYYYGFVMEAEIEGSLQMTFLTQSLEGFARWLMMFGDQTIILQPEVLKEKVKTLALKTLSLYP